MLDKQNSSAGRSICTPSDAGPVRRHKRIESPQFTIIARPQRVIKSRCAKLQVEKSRTNLTALAYSNILCHLRTQSKGRCAILTHTLSHLNIFFGNRCENAAVSYNKTGYMTIQRWYLSSVNLPLGTKMQDIRRLFSHSPSALASSRSGLMPIARHSSPYPSYNNISTQSRKQRE